MDIEVVDFSLPSVSSSKSLENLAQFPFGFIFSVMPTGFTLFP